MLLNKRISITFIFSSIKIELILVSFYALGIVFLDEYLNVRSLDLPMQIPVILGTAISLILGFRTSQAYERWWEARKIWGEIVNNSRTWVRLCQTYLSDKELEWKLTTRHIQWVKGMVGHLRHESDPSVNLLLSSQAADLRIAYDRGTITDFQFVSMNECLARLTDNMGKSERIKNTVFPQTYSLFVEVFLYLFVFLLPYSFIQYFHFMEAPLLLGISIPFFLLEKAAIQLQDPFRDHPVCVPIETISLQIENSLYQMFGKEPPNIIDQENYYLL